MTDENAKILVINPNSNDAVTSAISDGLADLRTVSGPQIICETLDEGPFGVESQADIDAVINPLRNLVATRPGIDAFVIACYSDPGLSVCRQATKKPVFGIHESALLSATRQATAFGVIALSDISIARHLDYHKQIGVAEKLAGERAVDLTVDQGATDSRAFERLCRAGEQLRDRDGADILILGCAGLASHRAALAKYLDLPVIDPTYAATQMAIDALSLSDRR